MIRFIGLFFLIIGCLITIAGCYSLLSSMLNGMGFDIAGLLGIVLGLANVFVGNRFRRLSRSN